MKHKRLFSVLLAVLLLTLTARAASEARILQKRLDPNTKQWTLYVRHDGDIPISGVSADGADIEDAVITKDPGKTSLVTWILTDNSASMPEDVRGKVSDLLLTLLENRGRGEVHTFCTFSDRLHVKLRYSGNFPELKQQVDALEYDGGETDLMDALDEVLTQAEARDSTEFARILLISAGGASVPSASETRLLRERLRADNIPVYTVGCATDSNADILSWMYALSTGTYARSWDIDAVAAADVANIMRWEEIPVRVFLTLPEGGDVEVTFADGTLSRVALPATETKSEPETATETESEPDPQPQPETDSEPTTENTEKISVWGVLLSAILLACGVGGAAFWISGGWKNARPRKVTFRGETTSLTLYLQDIDAPEREFHAPLRGRVTVGRSDDNMIVLDYDQSISRRHCEICFQNGGLWIRDSNSSGGAYVNGERVTEAVALPEGAVVRLGHVSYHVEARREET